MANSLDLTGLERQDSHLGPRIPERLHGLRQFRLLEAIGSKNRTRKSVSSDMVVLLVCVRVGRCNVFHSPQDSREVHFIVVCQLI